MTVWSTTNVALPFNEWSNMGNPTEVSPGNYQFSDPSAANLSQRFYYVTSPQSLGFGFEQTACSRQMRGQAVFLLCLDFHLDSPAVHT